MAAVAVTLAYKPFVLSMEPIVGVLVLFFTVLAAMSSSSSDRDERRPPRDSYRNNPVHPSNRRYDDDEWDDEDYDDVPPYWPPPYYPPPYSRQRQRRNRFRELVLAFFMGILVFSVVVAGVVYQSEMVGLSQTRPDDKKPSRPMDQDAIPLGSSKPVEAKPIAMKKELETLLKPYLIRLTITDIMTFRQIQQTYPKRNIEAFLDNNQRYWVCIFANSSQELDDIRDLLRLREDDLKEHGLSIVFYEATDLCSGKIVREKGTDIWFCQGIPDAITHN